MRSVAGALSGCGDCVFWITPAAERRVKELTRRDYGTWMDEDIKYPVCPHRNVPAAFERFLGPDSGGIERFFPDPRGHRLDDTVREVRMKGRRAIETFGQASHRAALLACEAAILVRALLVVVADAVGSRVMHLYRSLQERFPLLTRTAI